MYKNQPQHPKHLLKATNVKQLPDTHSLVRTSNCHRSIIKRQMHAPLFGSLKEKETKQRKKFAMNTLILA